MTEAVRGEGGRLFNAGGERFMARYDRERMELSTRDRVALASYTETRRNDAARPRERVAAGWQEVTPYGSADESVTGSGR